jgi:hypothetical protein
MELIKRDEIISALERLGQLAIADGETLQLVLVGGAAMVVGYNARESTHDVDAVVLPPPDASAVRSWAHTIAAEFGWPGD